MLGRPVTTRSAIAAIGSASSRRQVLQCADHGQDAEPGGTLPTARPAPSAQQRAKLPRVDGELVQDALPLPRSLGGPRVVPAGVGCERAVLARVPRAHPPAVLVQDVEAV